MIKDFPFFSRQMAKSHFDTGDSTFKQRCNSNEVYYFRKMMTKFKIGVIDSKQKSALIHNLYLRHSSVM